jgi:putative heme-binding domain-containing protein
VFRFFLISFCLISASPTSNAWGQAKDVLQGLLRQSADKLAEAAMAQGDATRGAQLFFQPSLGCATCHATSDAGSLSLAQVGPNLTRPNQTLTNEEIVDSILRPSKMISQGFETTQVLVDDGQVLTGILVSQSDQQVKLRDASTGQILTVEASSIEALKRNPLSIMPEGVAGQLTSRNQFLDLVRYIIELRDGGPRRALQLQPKVLPGNQPLPEYEAHLDHAGLIRAWDDEAYKRGEEIYSRSCVTCHGTVTQEGSLPTSLRFASGKFKNGYDPLAMYRTITHGYGLMTPQRWLVPSQKYDVIHYIRQAFLRPHNPSQFAPIDPTYLDSLPKGDTRGPAPSLLDPWQQMDYGPNLMATYEVGNDGSNIAYKGHAIRLDEGPGGVAQGQQFILYEHDTMRVAATWSGQGFVDWNGINFNGAHQKHPRIVGEVLLANRAGPGWANPADDSFDEVRQAGRDGRFYGPLPKTWIDYQGTYVNGPDTLLSYRVGTTDILEWPHLSQVGSLQVVERHLSIAPNERPLTMRVADRPECTQQSLPILPSFNGLWSESQGELPSVLFGIVGQATGAIEGLEWQFVDGELRLHFPASTAPRRLTLVAAQAADRTASTDWLGELAAETGRASTKFATLAAKALSGVGALKSGANEARNAGQPHSRRWSELLSTPITVSDDSNALAVDTIHYPADNPWQCRMRLTGLDFYADGDSAVVCDWDGNVWRVRHLHSSQAQWERIASGLFQPLGIKIRDGEIFVCCRDQICRLHDTNGDGETDFYESFNHDHIITEHFHEFAMGLQCDEAGNFYYAKSARHALPAVVPHHGTLLKVAADGSTTEILANGFRAANGVCLNGDGTFFVTDQEGHWNPKNRINWVKPGQFYGNMFGYHEVTDESDQAMTPPLCWITNAFDRSPAELLWVTSHRWGPLTGSLLNMSYGYGKLYVVPHELKGDQMQGGMCELPIDPLPTGIMRGRFHPSDGGLYVVGMFAWAGNQTQDGGFYRVRYTGKPLYVPTALHCQGTTVRIGLSDEVDPSSVSPESFSMSRWSLKRSAKYGSEHYDTRTWEVASARWDADQRELVLEVPELEPTWCMEIVMDLRAPDGTSVHRVLHNTIHSTGLE